MKIGCMIVALCCLLPAGGQADLYCDGDPPELHNKDARSYAYQIKCASKIENGEIKASETKKLEGKSGCQLTVGNGEPVKLFTEMICEILNGKLSCDLIVAEVKFFR